MIQRIGTKEIPDKSNSDKKGYIDSINKEFGLYKNPYCAMAVSNVSKNITYPKLWSARALDLAKYNKHSIKDVLFDIYRPKAGDLIVYDYGNGKGHVDIVISYDSNFKIFHLVGANRSDAIRELKITINEMILRKAKYIVNVIPIVKKDIKIFRYDTTNVHVTFYGGKFHNQKTANGEYYDTTKFTAAHKTLKFGTIVKVINPRNNKSVFVRINDRCLKKNILDMTPVSIRELGISSQKCLMVVRNAN